MMRGCSVNTCGVPGAGDVNAIHVGANSNIQDGTVVHVARHNPKGQEAPTTIGDNVTIGATRLAQLCAPCPRQDVLGLTLCVQATARPYTRRL